MYEIAMSVHRAKCVHIAGPFKGGVHDLDIFRQGGLKEKLQNARPREVPQIKLSLVDRGYRTSQDDEQGLFSNANPYGSQE
jgi:hypothetical protein